MVDSKVVIIKIRKPTDLSVNQELQWLGNSLGLFGQRDKDRSCFRIFIELVKSTRGHKPLSSDELAYHLDLTRGTVVHHLNRLMESGLVVIERKRYLLRDNQLESVIVEIERDVERTFEEMKKIARELDNSLGL